jgi:alpha-L-fucosidase
MTIGRHWQYVGSDYNKDATKLIEQLVEIRAKGGNLLLNVGPDASGQIPELQKARLREMGLWLMANGDAIYDSRPGEEYFLDDIWFTQSIDQKKIFAILNGRGWERMQTRSFLLSCIEGNSKTKVTVLGQGDGPSEYDPRLLVAPKYAVTNDGFFVSLIRAQRLNDTWDNPVVLQIEHAQFFKKSEKDQKK